MNEGPVCVCSKVLEHPQTSQITEGPREKPHAGAGGDDFQPLSGHVCSFKIINDDII